MTGAHVGGPACCTSVSSVSATLAAAQGSACTCCLVAAAEQQSRHRPGNTNISCVALQLRQVMTRFAEWRYFADAACTCCPLYPWHVTQDGASAYAVVVGEAHAMARRALRRHPQQLRCAVSVNNRLSTQAPAASTTKGRMLLHAPAPLSAGEACCRSACIRCRATTCSARTSAADQSVCRKRVK